ncbi:stage II sporulation protein E, partial [Striga asiatica]
MTRAQITDKNLIPNIKTGGKQSFIFFCVCANRLQSEHESAQRDPAFPHRKIRAGGDYLRMAFHLLRIRKIGKRLEEQLKIGKKEKKADGFGFGGVGLIEGFADRECGDTCRSSHREPLYWVGDSVWA